MPYHLTYDGSTLQKYKNVCLCSFSNLHKSLMWYSVDQTGLKIVLLHHQNEIEFCSYNVSLTKQSSNSNVENQ